MEEALRPGRYISEHASFSLVNELESVAARIAEADPKCAIGLYETFIAACYEKADEVDGSSGYLGMFGGSLFARWITARKAVSADPVGYARGLGFEPHADFAKATGHLGEWDGVCDLEFGRDGMPMYIEGPHDDTGRIMHTLRQYVQLLLAAAAISRGDPMTAGILAGALRTARLGGFLNTVVTTAPQLTSYLVEHSVPAHPDPFTEQLVGAALEVRAAQPEAGWSRRVTAKPLTAAESRVLKLLPTSTYPQIAAALYISRSTVKTHLQSVYHKLEVVSRSEAIERAVDLRLL